MVQKRLNKEVGVTFHFCVPDDACQQNQFEYYYYGYFEIDYLL